MGRRWPGRFPTAYFDRQAKVWRIRDPQGVLKPFLALIEEYRDAGIICPLTGQLVKTYTRPLDSAMASGIIEFFHAVKGKHGRYKALTDVAATRPRFARGAGRGGDFAKLRYWGLVREARKHPEETHKTHSGAWCLTAKGCKFVRQQARVRSHVQLEDGVFQKLTGDLVDIVDCLGTHFDYDDLMNG